MSDLQLFPALDPATEAALRHSIRRWGVLVPIFVSAGPWQKGTILDGHHRSRIAEEEGCGPPSTIPIPVETEEDAHELARTLNMDRRHLDADQRRLIVADLRAAGFSIRDIAGAVGASVGTVHNDLADPEVFSPEHVGEIHGRDGKTYPPAKAPRPIEPLPESPEVAPEPLELDHATLQAAAAQAAERNEIHEAAANSRTMAAELDAEEAERFPRDAQWQLLIDPLTRLAQVNLDVLEEGPPRITNWAPVVARIGVDLHRLANVIDKYAEGEP